MKKTKIESFFRITRMIMFALMSLSGIILLFLVITSQDYTYPYYVNVFSELIIEFLHVGSIPTLGILSSILLVAFGAIGILTTLKDKRVILYATLCFIFSLLMVDDQTIIYWGVRPKFDMYMLSDLLSLIAIGGAALNWVLQFIQNRVRNVASVASKLSKDKTPEERKTEETEE